MKKSHLINLVKEELKGYSKYTGTTQGLTDKELERILTMIAKEDDEEETNEITNPVDRLTLDIPLFIRLLEYAKEDAKTDMDLHDLTEKAIKLGSVPGTALSMKDYDALVSDQAELAEEKPGLWANIRAKRARGEKPSHGNSKAFKDAVKAGKRINKMTENESETLDALHTKIEKFYGRKLEPSQISVMTGKNDYISNLLSKYRELKRANENSVKEDQEQIKEAKKDNVNIYIPILDRVANQLSKIDSEKYKKAIDHISDAIFELLGETKDSPSRLEKVKNHFIDSVKFQLKRLKVLDDLEEDVYEKILNKLPEYTDQLYRDYSDDPEYAAQYMAELFN